MRNGNGHAGHRLRLVKPPEAKMPKRVDFYTNRIDQTVIVAALLGWRHRDIAAFTGLTVGQVAYRVYCKLGVGVAGYRGESRLSQAILRDVRDRPMMQAAKMKTLRAADITPEMDHRKVKVLA